MIKSIKSTILASIKNHPQGWVFTAYDFIHEFNRGEIDDSLSTLVEEGEIRRIIRGIYDYPRYGEILNINAEPNIEQVANAIARKFSWKIYPNGAAVLRDLGLYKYTALAAQISERNIYLTDGPNKKYYVENHCIEFKHISLKETSFIYPNTCMLIQAIKAVGKDKITPDLLIALKNKFSYKEWKQIKTDAVNSTGWVYDIIKDLCK